MSPARSVYVFASQQQGLRTTHRSACARRRRAPAKADLASLSMNTCTRNVKGEGPLAALRNQSLIIRRRRILSSVRSYPLQ